MKKLAVISLHTSPLSRLGIMDAGGMNVYILNLSTALIKLGWQVDVFTRQRKKTDTKPRTVFEQLRVIPIPSGDYNLDKKQLLGTVDEFTRTAATFMDTNGPYDLIHAHYFLSGLVGVGLKQRCRIPLVMTFHTLGIMKQLYGNQSETARIEQERAVVAAADRFVVSTKLEKHLLTKHYMADAQRIAVITPGVEHDMFQPRNKWHARDAIGYPRNRKLVVFVGRIDPIKGLTTLLQALGDMTKKHLDFHRNVSAYIIGGDIENEDFWQTPEMQKINRLIKQYNLECCVEFLGAKPHEQLADYYAAADVVVFPSYYESFSLATLEAMAVGSAVLASRVGGLQILVKDGQTGWLFENKNEAELCRKLIALLEDDDERQRLGYNAHVFSHQFSWDAQARRVADIYQRLQ